MLRIRVEFTVEPFVDGSPGPHVLAAIDAARTAGLEPEVGPFGTTIEGAASQVGMAIDRIVTAAVGAGATRVSLQATTVAD